MDDMRDSLSKMKKRVKQRLTGRKRKPDETGANPSGGAADSTTSLPPPDPQVVADESLDRGGDGPNASEEQPFSTDRPLQPGGPESGPAPGSDKDQGGEETGVDVGRANQRYSHPHPDVGSERSGKPEGACPSPPVPPVSHGAEPDST